MADDLEFKECRWSLGDTDFENLLSSWGRATPTPYSPSILPEGVSHLSSVV